jgi:hypothetical protein
MKPLAFAGLALIAALSFTACDPKPRSRPEPAPGPHTTQPRPGDATLPPGNDPEPRTTQDGPNPKPQGNVIPPAPTQPRNPEYGIKIEGKTGYVKSPYDTQGRPIDVRGLPPGTEVEDPYTPGRTLLVP